MTNAEAIEIIENEYQCVKTASVGLCGRNCSICDLLKTDKEIFDAYDLAVKALQKQVPRRPHIESVEFRDKNFISYTISCSNCGKEFEACFNTDYNKEFRYCSRCGHAIDWGDQL